MEATSIDIHKEYIDRCKQGDTVAFNKLYNLYAKSMYNVAWRIVKNEDLAKDILQDAFIKAYQKIHQFDYQATFGAWLKRIVINQSLDLIRKQKANMLNFSAEYDTEIVEEEEKDWDMIDLTVDKVKKALNTLPDGFRIVCSMFLFEGFEHKEIAQVLGISESTSKSQYHRAKLKLREIISDYER